MENKNLTIIVPAYHPTNTLEDIFYNILKQKDHNFDVILLIDRPSDNDFETIEKLRNKLGKNLKLVINTSHQHIDIVLKQASELVETEYSYVLYSYSKLKSEFVSRINSFLNSVNEKPDFVELPGILKGFIHNQFNFEKFSGIQNKVLEIEKNKEIVSKIAPFSFNFIIKNEILKLALEHQKSKDINLQMSPSLSFKSILLSKTFAFLDTTWVEDYNYDLMVLNIKSLQRNWDEIFKLAKELNKQDYFEVLEFSKFINFAYYFAGYLGTCRYCKRSKTQERALHNLTILLDDVIKKQNEELNEEWNKNPYFSKPNVLEIKDLALSFTQWDLLFKKKLW
ncbi:glycosyltransferase family 2 protein [Mycoplasma struthionis]|uniref:Glycosyltransferase family 2 protein n=1 Tax=Mycoplasma struthionis TaxID=538220 RepID=A0A502M9J7_9MOLU|nr:glycosyltransferase family 2 protein [Mycoplasma struthionis]TPI02539.1 glycosyltransferase family 2 protein [Mycoplasma struthionis]